MSKKTPLCPAHKEHGRTYPKEGKASEEVRWCGRWFYCTRCTSSVLIPSKELLAHLAAQPARH